MLHSVLLWLGKIENFTGFLIDSSNAHFRG